MNNPTKHLRAGEILIAEGELSQYAYLITKGKFEVSKSQGHETVILGYRKRGDIVGEMGLVQDLPRMATIKAVIDSEVELISKESLHNALKQAPPLVKMLMVQLFERVRESADELLFAGQRMSDDVVQSDALPISTIKLVPQTPLCRKAAEQREISINNFPFKIGRYTSSAFDKIFNKNDLSLTDEPPFQVSRSHVKIGRHDGGLVVYDLGSRRGTWVNGTRIGIGAPRNFALLTVGHNHLILGRKGSKFRFSVLV